MGLDPSVQRLRHALEQPHRRRRQPIAAGPDRGPATRADAVPAGPARPDLRRAGSPPRSPASAYARTGMSFDLDRFVQAQAGTYESALRELRDGRKTGHWIWFIFPQGAGLGRSEVSRFYAIESLGEAQAYLAHPVLGPRLRECAAALLSVPGR